MQESLREENEEPCGNDVRSMFFKDFLKAIINVGVRELQQSDSTERYSKRTLYTTRFINTCFGNWHTCFTAFVNCLSSNYETNNYSYFSDLEYHSETRLTM